MSNCCNEKESCDCGSGLINVTDSRLQELLNADPDSALGRSIRRLVKGLDDPNGVISAFSNFVDSH